AFKYVAFPIDRKAEEIDVEFLGLADVEHTNDRDCGQKLYARAGFWTRSSIGQLGCQDVPVVEAELLGDELQALGHREGDVFIFQIVAQGLRHGFGVAVVAHCPSSHSANGTCQRLRCRPVRNVRRIAYGRTMRSPDPKGRKRQAASALQRSY